MKTIKTIVSTILLGVCSNLIAQDVHFSQFDMAPLTLNPANAGAIQDNYRIGLNYRDQWRSVTAPYQTFALAYDMVLLKDKGPKGWVGAGIQLYKDQAGDNKLSTTKVALSMSYHVALTDKFYFTGGLNTGYVQRSIDNTTMQWDNQYDGTGYNSTYASAEPVITNNKVFGDVGAGLRLDYFDNEDKYSNNGIRASIGAAMFHANKPNLSYYNTFNEKLYNKMIIHANAFYPIKSTNYALLPSVLYVNQQITQEIVAGSLIRYRLKEGSKLTSIDKETAIYVGAHYRVSDAVIAELMLEYAGVFFGFSYDVNTSGLKTASNSKGGFEISIKVTDSTFKKRMVQTGTPSF